jgi:heme exporter protein D
MDQHVLNFAQWLQDYTFLIYLALAMAVVPLIMMYRSVRGMRAAARIIKNQFNRMSQDDIEAMEAYADRYGRAQLVRDSLRAIREQHGCDGVRVGHVMLIMKAIHDDFVLPTQWPSFQPPEGTPDPAVVSM